MALSPFLVLVSLIAVSTTTAIIAVAEDQKTFNNALPYTTPSPKASAYENNKPLKNAPVYVATPKTEAYETKPFNNAPVYVAPYKNQGYTTKPFKNAPVYLASPKTEEYASKPFKNAPVYVASPKTEEYTSKPFKNAPVYVASSPTSESYKSKPFENAPVYVASPKTEDYETKPFNNAPVYVASPKSSYEEKPFKNAPAYVVGQENRIQVQGTIYCVNRNGKAWPLQGANARVACIATSKTSYVALHPFSVVSDETDQNGYFKINLSKYTESPFKLTACKVLLDSPAPAGGCNVATDINRGLTGATVPYAYRQLSDSSRLYSVPTFFYTTGGGDSY